MWRGGWGWPPGTADTWAAARSRFTQLLGPESQWPRISPTPGSITGSLGAVRSPFPRPDMRPPPHASLGVPHLVPRCAIILSSAEKLSIYPSFSPWSFLLLRIPDTAAFKRSSPWLCLRTPFLPTRDLPFASPSPPEEPPIHTCPFFLKSSRYFRPPAFCGVPKREKASRISAIGF